MTCRFVSICCLINCCHIKDQRIRIAVSNYTQEPRYPRHLYISSTRVMVGLLLASHGRETSREGQRPLFERPRCVSSLRIQRRIQERFHPRGTFRVVIHYSWCCAVNCVSPCRSRYSSFFFIHPQSCTPVLNPLWRSRRHGLGCRIQVFNPLTQC